MKLKIILLLLSALASESWDRTHTVRTACRRLNQNYRKGDARVVDITVANGQRYHSVLEQLVGAVSTLPEECLRY